MPGRVVVVTGAVVEVVVDGRVVVVAGAVVEVVDGRDVVVTGAVVVVAGTESEGRSPGSPGRNTGGFRPGRLTDTS